MTISSWIYNASTHSWSQGTKMIVLVPATGMFICYNNGVQLPGAYRSFAQAEAAFK